MNIAIFEFDFFTGHSGEITTNVIKLYIMYKTQQSPCVVVTVVVKVERKVRVVCRTILIERKMANLADKIRCMYGPHENIYNSPDEINNFIILVLIKTNH